MPDNLTCQCGKSKGQQLSLTSIILYCQELKDIEEQHIKNITLASRVTEADLKNDRGTPLRRLEVPLYLLISNNDDPQAWQMPQGDVKDGESLRQVYCFLL